MTPLTDLFGRALKIFRQKHEPKYAKIQWQYNEVMFDNLSNYILKLKKDLENEKEQHKATINRYLNHVRMEEEDTTRMLKNSIEDEKKIERLENELHALRMDLQSVKKPKCGECHLPYLMDGAGPRVLACGHSICVGCARDLIHIAANGEQVILCPQDGIFSFLNGEGLHGLPPNKELMKHAQHLANLRIRHSRCRRNSQEIIPHYDE